MTATKLAAPDEIRVVRVTITTPECKDFFLVESEDTL